MLIVFRYCAKQISQIASKKELHLVEIFKT